MNPIQLIATLRKLGNYMVGLFPVLALLAERISESVTRVKRQRHVHRLRARFKMSKRARAIAKFLERFYWRTYSKDRHVFDESLGSSLNLVRRPLQVSVLLCISILLTQFRWYPISVETYSALKTTVPFWSAICWVLAMPLAWTTMLLGAAQCNRIVFAVAAYAGMYFICMAILFAERSYCNLLPGLSVICAFVFCEQKLGKNSDDSLAVKFRSALAIVFAGAVCGVQMTLLSPLKSQLAALLKLPGPVVGIAGGASLGIALTIALLFMSKTMLLRKTKIFDPDSDPHRLAWLMNSMLVVTLFCAAGRTSLSTVASGIVSSLTSTNSFFWPFWYFIGVGILHKIVSSSRVAASSVEQLLPKLILKPVLILALLIGLLVAGSESIYYFSSNSTWLPQVFSQFAAQIFLRSKDAIWSVPSNVLTAHWTTWVLLFDFILIIYLSVRKQLSSEVLLRIFYLTCIAALLISEYVFQLSSFAKPATTSVTVLFFFSAWLIWLLHTVGWDTALKSSPLWPSAGRLFLLAGTMCIAILHIQARAAIQDFKVMNEIFLTMFRGVIDIGLPYYLYVWCSRTMEKLPIRIPTMLGLFVLGGLVSLLFNIGEKFAIAHWSFPVFRSIITLVNNNLVTTGSPNLELPTPSIWYLVRAISFAALLTVIAVTARKHHSDELELKRSLVFLRLSFASGVASFSKTMVDLPIPPSWMGIISPVAQQLTFNCDVFQSFLSYWIPALLLSLFQFRNKPNKLAAFGTLFIVAALNYGIAIAYVQHEAYLRASGIIYPVTAGLFGAFCILVAILQDKISDSKESAFEAYADAPVQIMSQRSFIGLVAVIELFAFILIVYRVCVFRTELVNVPALKRNVVVCSEWKRLESAAEQRPDRLRLTRKSDEILSESFDIGRMSYEESLTKCMQSLIIAEQERHPGLSVSKLESMGRIRQGALVCYYSYEVPYGRSTTVLSSLAVVVPAANKLADFYIMSSSPLDFDQRRWEILLALDSR